MGHQCLCGPPVEPLEEVTWGHPARLGIWCTHRSFPLYCKYLVQQQLFRLLDALVSNKTELSNIESQLSQFALLTHPDYVSAKPEHHPCLKIDAVTLSGKVRNHKATTLDLTYDFVVNPIYVRVLVNSQWRVPTRKSD